MQKFAEENQRELENQKKKVNISPCGGTIIVIIFINNDFTDQMSQRTKIMANSVWTSFGMILWIIGLFVGTYAIIRVVSKPTSRRSCDWLEDQR